MSFQSSLRIGQLGEMLYYQAHAGTLKREDGRVRDFTHIPTGEGLELKFDLYPMSATPNMFFERWSNEPAQMPGGPWQAQANGNKQFVYFYGQDLTAFQFDTDELVAKLEQLAPSLVPVGVGPVTVGYRVRRDELAPLYKEIRLNVSISTT